MTDSPTAACRKRRHMTATTVDTFLTTHENDIDWVRPDKAPAGIQTVRVHTGHGVNGLEVAVAQAASAPKMDEVRRLWKQRWDRRPSPVLLVVGYPAANGTWEATVCGTNDDPAAIAGLDLGQVDRICAAALAEPNASAAKRTLERLLSGPKDQLIAGVTNQGLFASHELRHGVPIRADWETARSTGAPLLAKTGGDLITGLGYTTAAYGSTAHVLSNAGTDHAVAVLLDETELFDRPASRFGAVSPVQQGIALAQDKRLPWLIVTRGTQIRLYPTDPDVGVGRKGQATYLELDLALLTAEDAAYLPLLFSPDALDERGSVAEILAASADHATGLGQRLRERVYRDVVPKLAVAVGRQMKAGQIADMTEDDLAEAYHRTLIILFRLLFVAYAEDRGLLPYQRNPRYTRKALKTFARDYTTTPDADFDEDATDLWEDLVSVWKAVDDGNSDWDVPAYNGGLFAVDDRSPSGQAIKSMILTNAEIGPALKALLIDDGVDGTRGPVDFRTLSVRNFGTIYEGLLESSLSIAPTDLTVDPKTEAYLPAKIGSNVVVSAGEIYFHNASGARKATGSYFTKEFAVEHLLNTTLEPALDDHLAAVRALLDAGDDAAAADKFFDFRIADLAMGSGHFLVAAIDRIENRFNKFLAEHTLPVVEDELARLGAAAKTELGAAGEGIEILPGTLLRRQIARRCIYGLDINLMAVELARLAIWIHTFVPGLPMSSLDHGLVVGNSLTGIGTVDEVLDVLEPKRTPGQDSLFTEALHAALDTARTRLLRVARTAEAKKADVKKAAEEHVKAMAEAADAKAMFDAAIGLRVGVVGAYPITAEEAVTIGNQPAVQAKVAELKAMHLPYLFPEVFLRPNPGFDALIGNPPWEKVKVEEHQFWAVRQPGLRALNRAAQSAAIQILRQDRPDLVTELDAAVAHVQEIKHALYASNYPGIQQGDADLYKAFAWRNWALSREGARIGVVLPRSAFTSSSASAWRHEILAHGCFEHVTLLLNTGTWVFDDVHAQYAFGLASVRRGPGLDGVQLNGPFASRAEYEAGKSVYTHFPADVFRGFTSGAAFPFLPNADSVRVFKTLRLSPRFDQTDATPRFRPLRELHATDDKDLFLEQGDADDPMPVYTGVTLDLWAPDSGAPYAWAETAQVEERLFVKRLRQIGNNRSAFHGLPHEWAADRDTLPCRHPRIAFRDVTNQENARTALFCLVPGNVTLVHQAPYILRYPSATVQDEAFLLGVLSSRILDWYSRRVVERHLTMDLLNSFPIPKPGGDNVARLRVVEIAGRLAAVDERFADWAAEVGVPCGSVTDEDAKGDLIAELDALVALLYGLDRSDVEHVFATFHRGWDYQPRLDAVLGHYDRWKNEGN